MSPELGEQPIVLREQCENLVWLRAEDVSPIQKLGFDVRVVLPDPTALDRYPDRNCFSVNPKQYVAHLVLPSGTTLLVKPKIDPANVFRMLAYVYARWNRAVFQDPTVCYFTDTLLFEPLVRLFCDLVAVRAHRGLVQDYVSDEENLAFLRGKIPF